MNREYRLQEDSPQDHLVHRFLEHAHAIADIHFHESGYWFTSVATMISAEQLGEGWDLLFSGKLQHADMYFFHHPGLRATIMSVLTTGNQSASITIMAPRDVDASGIEKAFRSHFTPLQVDEDPHIRHFRFWGSDQGRVTSSMRALSVPAWAEVSNNYSKRTREELDSLMTFRGESGGKLILWHGEPGTGKTFALRALASEWGAQADIHYIMDPESLLNAPGYLSTILGLEDHRFASAGEVYKKIEQRKHLLIMEDSDEFLMADAKLRTGQALSRLLNLTDGLLGQGSGLYVLITTNEPVSKLHKAVSRPGRCLADIEFSSLSGDELAERSPEAATAFPGGCNLSELYAFLEGRAKVSSTSIWPGMK